MKRYAISAGIVLAALLVIAFKYWDYAVHPWTRNGQVRAQVIQIAPRVTAPIVQLPIADNQRVAKGDLLFEIDPRTFQAALNEAQARLDSAKITARNRRNDAKRYRNAARTSPGSISAEDLDQAEDEEKAAAVAVEAAAANVESRDLDLEFTQVRAPVDGYVTNLNLRLGSQAVANQPALALVDVNSFWVHGYFRETVIRDMRAGDRAVVTLMTYPDLPLEGRVESLGWGIAQDDGSTGYNLLPNVEPTFEWIRLAQRVPVRIQLVDLPEEVQLRVGTTASVLVMTGTHDDDGGVAAPPVPRPLQ